MERRHDAKSIRKKLRSQPEEDPEFQIAPMIDVLLVLLVFFMSISTTEIISKVEGIDLAIAADANDPEKAASQVILNVKWEMPADRGVVVTGNNNEYTNMNDITAILQEAYSKTPQMRVLVRADRNAKYEFTRSLMEAISRAQIPNITFSVVDKEVAE